MELQFDNQTPDTAKPVTVLGRTFANDEERRSYFREELRKQLPELKKIEGFPIGEDDDIINLSDPPYYTACPNPWINDFIAEWEAEKVELQAQGKRVANFEVDEPYASDVSEGKNNPIYNAHSYHTKVPHPAIMRYILHYTQPGDIVFDGFAGTGMTGVAAGMCGNPDKEIKAKIETEFKSAGLITPNWGARHAVCGDLSPVASFIAYNLNNNDDENSQNQFSSSLSELKKEYSYLYETNHTNGKKGIIEYTVWSDIIVCEICNQEDSFWNLFVRRGEGFIADETNCNSCNSQIKRNGCKKKFETIFDKELNTSHKRVVAIPVLICYKFDKKRYFKEPDQNDFERIEKIESIEISKWVPKNILLDGDKMSDPRGKGVDYVHQFYFRRTLFLLSELWDKSTLQNKWLITNSISRNLTKLNRFIVNSYNPNGRINGPLSGTFYVPSEMVEQNVFEILEYKQTQNSQTKSKTAIQVESATDLSNIQDCSVDYIFTDPPFGANIMYSELNSISESWLKVTTNSNKEAIENKTQNKNSLKYKNILSDCLGEYYRILKNGKWMTVEFSNTSAVIWNSIQTAITNSGFVIANVAALDKVHGGIKSMRYTTSVKQDLVISCYKPSSDFDTKFQLSQHSEVGIWDFVAEHLSHLPVHLVKDNATTAVIERSPKILFDRLIAFYVQRNLPVPIDAGLFQKGLKERFIERDGMYFISEQVHEYDSKKAELPNFVQLSLLVASEQDGVMWLRRELEHNVQTYQELQPKWMQALAGVRKGDILPELKDILEENFLQNESGAWYLPDLENEIDLEKVRTGRMLRLFATYREQASKPKGKLKEARVEALRVGFKQCYKDKDFKTIVTIGDSIPNNLLMEDEVLLQYYDIAISRV